MFFVDHLLENPSYGYQRSGKLYVPTKVEILREFFSRMNFIKDRKNWLPAFGWLASFSLSVPFFIFLFNYFSWPLVIAGFVYSMVLLGSYGTVWFHRYGTHHAFKFTNSFWRFLYRNAAIKIIPEEIYILSHHVHHRHSEKPGDPYNAHGGWLYCFLADANHQLINRSLSKADYQRACSLMGHTGVRMNSYAQYKKWGSICHPFKTIVFYATNWAVWYGIFFLLGGHALATALFGMSVIWAFGVRTFNYAGHGGGKDLRREGIDFFKDDFSINQVWPGYVAGEWHNNHHLFPNGARSGFLPYQLDLAWYAIWLGSKIGAVKAIRDYKGAFYSRFYNPYLEKMSRVASEIPAASVKA